MSERNWSDHLVRALAKVNARHRAESGDDAWPGTAPAFTIAISRTTGALGTSVARAVGARLGWPVYDHELLEKTANDMKVRVGLLEGMDERHVSWIQEMVEAFASAPTVSELKYFNHLVETLLSLGARGQCVLVGRGAPHLLPAARTLRVRVTAPVDFRVSVISRERGLGPEEAARFIDKSDRARTSYIRDYFLADPHDPVRYDLILNVSRFPVADCADLIVDALRRMEARAAGS